MNRLAVFLSQFRVFRVFRGRNSLPLGAPLACRAEALAKADAAGVNKSSHSRLNATASGGICELCVGKAFPFSALRHRCYRHSLAGTIVWAAMIIFHRLIGTWSKKVTAYIALTEFQKQKMIEGGLPANKVWVKPNFIDGASIKQKSEVRGQRSEVGEDH
jgi:hypothetical protein